MLLVRCAQSDRDAFRQLYELESARLYGVALRIMRQPEMAGDVLHDAMLQVWRSAQQFDPARGNASSWLTSLVRNRALNAASRAGRELAGVPLPDELDDALDPLERLSATSEQKALLRCLDVLEKRPRSLVTLSFMYGLTHSEVAARTGLPLGTVKSAIRRALTTLRACLDGVI